SDLSLRRPGIRLLLEARFHVQRRDFRGDGTPQPVVSHEPTLAPPLLPVCCWSSIWRDLLGQLEDGAGGVFQPLSRSLDG
ncbi:unnamed protein product, partial [Ectocarpus sp. 12 AP-2014]